MALETPRGHILGLFGMTVFWLYLWAWFDIMVVVHAFPPPLNAASNTGFYWIATWDFMFPLASMLAFRQHAWLPIAAQRAGAWEDVLFYWIQGKPFPDVVSNLPPTTTGTAVYIRIVAVLVIVVIVELWSHRVGERAKLGALVVAFAVAAFLDNTYAIFLLVALVLYLIIFSVLRAANVVYRNAEEEPKPEKVK